MKKINGVILPGGGEILQDIDDNLTKYYGIIDFIIQEGKKINDSGNYFPIFGTCLGFEGMIISLTGIPLDKNIKVNSKLKKIKIDDGFLQGMQQDLQDWV